MKRSYRENKEEAHTGEEGVIQSSHQLSTLMEPHKQL